jgi:hypothetical protein
VEIVNASTVNLHEQFGLLKQKYKPKRKISGTDHFDCDKFDIIAGDNGKGNFGTSIEFLK